MKKVAALLLVTMTAALFAWSAPARAYNEQQELIDKAPERVIQNAVKGMLPKNPLGRAMFKKLKVYAGNEHPHSAQQPQELNI